MTLCNRVLEIVNAGDQLQDAMIVDEFRRRRLRFAHRTTVMVADLRRGYGFGILPLFVWHVCSIALTAFLMEMSSANVDPSNRTHIDSSFEECFRCLLSAGMQQLLPRIVARSVWHTARELNVELPASVVQMLQLVADSAWQATDLHGVNAAYPSYAVPRANAGQTQDFALEDLVKKWEALSSNDDELLADLVQDSPGAGSFESAPSPEA